VLSEDRSQFPQESRARERDLLWPCLAIATGPAVGAWVVHSAADWTTWAKACEVVVFLGCPLAAFLWYLIGDR
jgi:hypothetical protein